MNEITVGIAAGRKYENYLNWILHGGNVKVIKLGFEEDNFDEINKCDGVILTGGEDVHPKFYNKPEYVSQYNLEDIDEARDEFELRILGHAEQQGLPLLGICRGLQIANVYFGGTLIPDIPSYGKPHHTKYEEGNDRHHQIMVMENSLLKDIAHVSKGEVNSAHHQSVDKEGRGLVISAQSEDGIIEAMERNDGKTDPFLLLVQWHPERMRDQLSPFSKNIRDRFLKACSQGMKITF